MVQTFLHCTVYRWARTFHQLLKFQNAHRIGPKSWTSSLSMPNKDKKFQIRTSKCRRAPEIRPMPFHLFHLKSDRLEDVAALLNIHRKHRPSITVLLGVKKIIRQLGGVGSWIPQATRSSLPTPATSSRSSSDTTQVWFIPLQGIK